LQEDIVGFKVEFLVLRCVSKAEQDFGQVQVVRLDVKSQVAHDLFQFVFEAFVGALVVEETVEDWVEEQLVP
jgi:hypothetical protein